MTIAQMVADLKELIGPGIDVSDNGLKNWLNDAYMYICDEISKVNPNMLANSAITATVANQQEYSLPADFDKMLIVNINYGSGWVRALPLNYAGEIPVMNDPAQAGQSQSEPFYYIMGDQIGFLPVPTTTTDDYIKLWYTSNPTELTDSESPVFPIKYHRLLKYWAYANYLDQDEEHVSAERLRQRFDDMLDRMLVSVEKREEDQPRSVTITSGTDLYTDDGMPY